MFKVKTEYYLESLITGTIKSLGSTESKITKDKNGENLPHLEITEAVLVHYNIANSDYQHNSGVSYTFICSKSFSQLLDISPKKNIFLKTFNSEFSYSEVWFNDQNSKRLETNIK